MDMQRPYLYNTPNESLLFGRYQLWCWWSSSVSLVLNQVPPPGMLVNNKYCPMLSQHCPDLIALLEIVSIVTMHVINIVMRNFNYYRNLYLWDTLFTCSSYFTFLWLLFGCKLPDMLLKLFQFNCFPHDIKCFDFHLQNLKLTSSRWIQMCTIWYGNLTQIIWEKWCKTWCKQITSQM